MEITTRRIILVLLATSILLGITTGGFIFLRIGILWCLILLVSRLWLSNITHGISIRRTIRASRAQVGQVFEEQFDIQNNSRFPLFWLELHDEAPLPGSQSTYVLNLIKGRHMRSFLLRTRLYQRGVFQFGPISLGFGDIFGLFRGTQTIPARATVVVYPSLFAIESFLNPPGMISGGEALRRRTHQITPNASGVRDYAPGDPLNRIHWLSSIRRERLIVKEFELDPLTEVWIFIDADSNTHTSIPFNTLEEESYFWDWLPLLELPAYTMPTVTTELSGSPVQMGIAPSTIEYCVSISASLAQYFLRQGRAVGLASVARSLTILPPEKSGRQLGKLLEALALLKADGELSLRSWAETQARHLTHGSIVILITPSVQPDVPLLADRLNHMGLKPVVILIDPASFGGLMGIDETYTKVRTLGIPVYRAGKGDNLGSILSSREL